MPQKIALESLEDLIAAELAEESMIDDDLGIEMDSWYAPAGYRWELDPLFAEDYHERYKGAPALKWRHFGH